MAILLVLLGSGRCLAQSVTISGYLTDATTGEALPGASVRQKVGVQGTAGNRYGFYSLTLLNGPADLVVSCLGYEPQALTVKLRRDTTISIGLKPVPQTLEEVTVRADAPTGAPVGLVQLPVARLRAVPVLLGEPDVIKALALTPGVTTGNEGSTGLLVRGGTPDQNLLLLDEATVYNASHLFGFVSIFNPDAIRNVELYKAGFPARYGGRLSSVLDVTMKEGNNQRRSGEASLGLLSSRLLLEGPVGGPQTSYLLSARSSYLGLFLLPVYLSYRQGNTDNYFNYWLYDVNAKLNHRFADGSRLFFSLYNGHDYWTAFDGSPASRSTFALNWGNTTATTRYSRTLSPTLFLRSVLTHSRYRYGLEGTTTQEQQLTERFASSSTVRDWAWRTDLDYVPSTTQQVRVGAELIRHRYQPSALTTTYAVNTDSLTQASAHIGAWEAATYLEDDVRPAAWLRLNAGLRASAFRVEGRTYAALEPRFSASVPLPAGLALKGSYSLMRQYIHLLSSSGAGFPNDIWVPATRRVAPAASRQAAVALTKALPRLGAELTVEGYHKTLTNLIDYRQGANFLTGAYSRDWQEEITTGGRGRAYGLEVFLNRTQGRFTGWASYAWAWNTRQFAGINQGAWYPARYDRRHSFSATGTYPLSKSWGLSATWVYSSGQPVTLPVGLQEDLDGNRTFVYAGRHNARMPAYHRLDLGATYTRTTRRGRTATWSLGVYNAYNRRNPFFLDFKDAYPAGNSAQPAQKQLMLRSLFPVLPSVTYSLKF